MRFRLLVMLIFTILWGPLGCVDPTHENVCGHDGKSSHVRGKHTKNFPTSIELLGYFAKSKTKCVGDNKYKYGFVDLHDVNINNRNSVTSLATFQPIETKHIVKLRVRKGKIDFTVFLGPSHDGELAI